MLAVGAEHQRPDRQPRLGRPDRAPRSGFKFKADKFGTITGLRFYKAATNTGTHTGTLWSATGQQLAQATFSGESASGWQTVTFSSPVEVQPDTTYVASYHAPNGHFSASLDYFHRGAAPGPAGGAQLDSPPLHALRNTGTSMTTTTNGVYSYSATEHLPDQHLRRGQLLGRRDLLADGGAGHRDRRVGHGRRQDLRQRELDGALERRRRDPVPHHAVRRRHRADVDDDHGAPPTTTDDHRA